MIKINTNGKRFQNRIPEKEMQRRWDAMTSLMRKHDIDCILTQANDAMLCQYARWLAEIRTEHYFYVMFDKDGNVSIFGHGGDNAPVMNPEIFPLKLRHNCCYPVFHNNSCGNQLAAKKVAGFIKEDGHKRVGIVGMNMITVAFYETLKTMLPDCTFCDFTEPVDNLIAVKSDTEMAYIADGVALHDDIAQAIPALVYSGRSEREFLADIIRLALIKGAGDFLNNLLVCSQPIPGPMYAMRYCNKLIEEGDVINVLIEVASMTGYYSELNHYWSAGKPSADVIQAFKYADECRAYMASLCVPGAVASDVFKKVNNWRAERNLGVEKRMHGHGQGYGLVERPYFDAQDNMVLKENMYISLHPKVMYKGISIGPGENYVIKKDGTHCLSKSTTSLIVL